MRLLHRNIFFLRSYYAHQQGIALLLSVVVLTAIFGLVISVSSIVLSVIRSNKAIGVSGVAFYAAESAAELVIYEIEKNNRGLDIADVINEPLDGPNNVTWDSQVRIQSSVPSLCSAPQAKPVCGNGNDVVSGSPLSVTLFNGQSFQLDMDIANALYPDRIIISWSGSGSTVYTMNTNGFSTETTSPVTFPQSPTTIDPDEQYRIRVVNNSGSMVTYSIEPDSTTALPLGLKITTTGEFGETIRIIELTRPSWLMY